MAFLLIITVEDEKSLRSSLSSVINFFLLSRVKEKRAFHVRSVGCRDKSFVPSLRWALLLPRNINNVSKTFEKKSILIFRA